MQTLSLRGRARALTRCFRWELLAGVPEGIRPSPALLRGLKSLDRDLEFYWHPRLKRWLLYRVLRRGVVPCEDLLVKELDLQALGRGREPGDWVLEWLRCADKTRGGAVDPTYADRDTSRHFRALEEREDREEKRQQDDFGQNLGGDMYDYGVKNRKHFTRRV